MAGSVWIQLNSELVFAPGKGPTDDQSLDEIAQRFAKRIDQVFAQKTGAAANMRVTRANHGAVSSVVHEGKITVEAEDRWETVRRFFEEQNDDIESWIEEEWRKDQRDALAAASVSMSAGAPIPKKPNVVAQEPKRDQKQRDRMSRATWRAYAIAGVVTLIAVSAWWNVDFLRQEVALLREETRAQRAQVPPAPQPVVVSCPPAQVRVVNDDARGSRVWRSRPN